MKFFSMQTSVCLMGAALLSLGCGGAQEPGVMTQEERLNQQIALGEQQKAKETEDSSRFKAVEADSEKGEKFDQANAEHELKRASLNAVDCPNAVPEADQRTYKPGTAQLKITFKNDGLIKNVEVSSDYADTAVGACVSRAYQSIQIKPFIGQEVTLDYKLELGELKKKPAPVKAGKKK